MPQSSQFGCQVNKRVCLIVLVIPSVVARKQVIDNREVKVDLFYPYLSRSTAAADSGHQHQVALPQDVVVSLDRRRSKFVGSSAKFRAEVESQLAACECRVQWPPDPATDDDDDARLVLHCTVDRDAADAGRRVQTWTDECRGVVDRQLARITSVDETVSADVWAGLEKIVI